MKFNSSFTLFAFIIFLSLHFSCSTQSNISTMESIVNKTWTMTSMNGERIDSTIYMNGAPSISFSNDGKLNGSTGCNSFSGSYKYEAGKLTLDPGAMTRMYCPGSNEEEYIEALNSVNYFKLKNDVLILLTNQEKEVMEFESSNK